MSEAPTESATSSTGSTTATTKPLRRPLGSRSRRPPTTIRQQQRHSDPDNDTEAELSAAEVELLDIGDLLVGEPTPERQLEDEEQQQQRRMPRGAVPLFGGVGMPMPALRKTKTQPKSPDAAAGNEDRVDALATKSLPPATNRFTQLPAGAMPVISPDMLKGHALRRGNREGKSSDTAAAAATPSRKSDSDVNQKSNAELHDLGATDKFKSSKSQGQEAKAADSQKSDNKADVSEKSSKVNEDKKSVNEDDADCQKSKIQPNNSQELQVNEADSQKSESKDTTDCPKSEGNYTTDSQKSKSKEEADSRKSENKDDVNSRKSESKERTVSQKSESKDDADSQKSEVKIKSYKSNGDEPKSSTQETTSITAKTPPPRPPPPAAAAVAATRGGAVPLITADQLKSHSLRKAPAPPPKPAKSQQLKQQVQRDQSGQKKEGGED